MNAFIIFLATFCVVFALGFQSLTVNKGQTLLAFFNSFLISLAQLAILKFVPQATGAWEYAAYMGGGPLGIVCSMKAHHYFFKH